MAVNHRLQRKKKIYIYCVWVGGLVYRDLCQQKLHLLELEDSSDNLHNEVNKTQHSNHSVCNLNKVADRSVPII